MTKFKFFAFTVAVGVAALVSVAASAATTQCWRCVGGWCCY